MALLATRRQGCRGVIQLGTAPHAKTVGARPGAPTGFRLEAPQSVRNGQRAGQGKSPDSARLGRPSEPQLRSGQPGI